MIEIKLLSDSSFLQLRSVEDTELNLKPYFYKHVKLYDGKIVAILPYRYTSYPFTFHKEFLLVNEVRPCWSLDDVMKLHAGSITGGVEKGITPEKKAVQELKEETGYEVEEKDLQFLGTSRTAKASDTLVYMYSVDLTDKIPGETKLDKGVEQHTKLNWVNDLTNCEDPLVAQMFVRWNSAVKFVS